MGFLPLPSDQTAFTDSKSGKPSTTFYSWLKTASDLLKTINDLLLGTTGAWTAYTPTVTSATGTITAYTATGRYYQIGKLVFVEFNVTITTVGTAAGNATITLPVTPNASFNYALCGTELTGPYSTNAWIAAGSGVCKANYYDATTMFASGRHFFCTGVYEAA